MLKGENGMKEDSNRVVYSLVIRMPNGSEVTVKNLLYGYKVKVTEVTNWAEKWNFNFDPENGTITVSPKTNLEQLSAELSEWGFMKV